MTKINKRTHSDYTQMSAYLPKSVVKNFKQLSIELDLDQSEAVEEALKEWCKKAVNKLNSK